MDANNFYSVMAATCFTLVGLWWVVVQFKLDWLKTESLRRLAGGVYVSFLLPGLMSLGAQIGGSTPFLWRAIFVIAALFGMFFTGRLLFQTRRVGKPGFFRRNYWVVILLYLFILIFAAIPGINEWIGLQPLQVQALLLTMMIAIAHGLTWEFMMEPKS